MVVLNSAMLRAPHPFSGFFPRYIKTRTDGRLLAVLVIALHVFWSAYTLSRNVRTSFRYTFMSPGPVCDLKGLQNLKSSRKQI